MIPRQRFSINRLVLEPYKGSGKIEAQVNSGFATVKQKTNLVGLRLLEPAQIQNDRLVFELRKGCKVYFTEETLHAAAWAKKQYECPIIEEKFILGDISQVVFVDEPEEA